MPEQIEQLFLEFPPRLLVHRGERLIHQDDVGIDCQGAREPNALLHPARELVRVARLEVREAGLGDLPARDLGALLLGNAAQLQAEGDVPQHVRPGEQGKILKDKGALRPRALHLFPLYPDLAAARRDQPGDDLKEGCLAAPARA